MHGKTSRITTTQTGVFAGLPAEFTVNRYHSLAIERASCPEALEITAWTEDGEIMGVRHKTLPQDRADGGRTVPPRVDPDRAWARHAEELPALRGRVISAIPSPAGAPMTMIPVDLRSDTVTRPEQRHACRDGRRLRWGTMSGATTPVSTRCRTSSPPARLRGRDVRAQRHPEQPVRHSGPLRRGDEYIVGQFQHTYRWEGGGAAVFGSVQPQPLENQPDGTLLLSDIEAAIKPDDIHYARTRLLALENTWSGKLLPMTFVQDAPRACAPARAEQITIWTVRACSMPRWRRRPSDRRQGAGRGAAHCHLLRQRVGLPEQGPGRTGRLGAVWRARLHHPRPSGSARWRAVACASAACWPPPAPMHWTTRWTAWPTTTGWRSAWPGVCRGWRACRSRHPQTNIVFVDLVGTARARAAELLPWPGAPRRAGLRPVPLAFRDPSGRGRRRRGPCAIDAMRGFFQG
jgi:threonine aldolase